MFTHCGTVEIETERLLLRRFQLTDAEDALRYWLSYPMVTYRYMFGGAYADKESVEALLAQWIDKYSTSNFYKWAIEEQVSGACIGDIYLWGINENEISCEMGFALGEAFGGKGYMTEASKAVINFSFDVINALKVNICTRSSNIASQNVIAKCGFTQVDTAKDALWENGVQCDRYFYSLMRDKWLSAIRK